MVHMHFTVRKVNSSAVSSCMSPGGCIDLAGEPRNWYTVRLDAILPLSLLEAKVVQIGSSNVDCHCI